MAGDVADLRRTDGVGLTHELLAPFWIPARIWSRIQVVDLGHRVGPCWIASGWSDGKGHAKARFQGRCTYIHRIVTHLWDGTPLFELDNIDHLCRNRPCCHPLHLEDVTPKINTDRGLGVHTQYRRAA